MKLTGWTFFLFAAGLFCLQMGYLVILPRYGAEYIDDRLFYLINISSVIFLLFSLLVLLSLSKWWKIFISIVTVVFIVWNGFLLVESNKEIRNITSISPDFKNVFSIKNNTETGEAFYYRSYYGILGRPHERLPHQITSGYKVEWLEKDVAAFTYETEGQNLQQFIGTYGDRKNGQSYYYVGAEIHGRWQGENAEVVSHQEGITITVDDHSELFPWDDIQQFGTLAIVLNKNNEAAWTIALMENFVVHSDAAEPIVGNISLYKATMDQNAPIVLDYQEME